MKKPETYNLYVTMFPYPHLFIGPEIKNERPEKARIVIDNIENTHTVIKYKHIGLDTEEIFHNICSSIQIIGTYEKPSEASKVIKQLRAADIEYIYMHLSPARFLYDLSMEIYNKN